MPDLSLEAEYIAFAAEGSKGAGYPAVTLNGIAPVKGIDLPSGRIDLVGITLDEVGPGGQEGPVNLIRYVKGNFSLNTGNPFSGVNEPVDFAGDLFLNGKSAPQGWLVMPHAGGNMSAAQVAQIIQQGINTANQTRSQLRPLGQTAEMVLAVTDAAGDVLGFYRMPDAPIFSEDVALSKGRDVAYYDNPATQLTPADQLPGIPAGTAFTARTFRFLALPHYPEGIDVAPPGAFSILNDPGTNHASALNSGTPEPISAFTSVFGFDAFHPNTTFQSFSANASGIVFFPGSSAVYSNGQFLGGGRFRRRRRRGRCHHRRRHRRLDAAQETPGRRLHLPRRPPAVPEI